MPIADPYRASLARLAEHLRTTTDFSSAFDLFDRRFGSDRRFIAASVPTTSELLERSLEHLAHKIVGRDATWRWMTPLLRYVPGRILHGAALVGGRITVVFYFEEHDLGLVTICGDETHFARFSKLSLPPGTMVARDRGHA